MSTRRIPQSKSSVGFTLIELLVVIAIIAILAAILFPVFASAREKARQTTCASNLKQLGLAFVQYNQDYDEVYPCGRIITPTQNFGVGWAGELYPYVKATAVYACPDDSTTVNATGLAAGFVTDSYAMNDDLQHQLLLQGNAPDPLFPTAYNISKLNSPSLTVLLFEVQNVQGYTGTVFTPGMPVTNYALETHSAAGTGGYDFNSNNLYIEGDADVDVYATGPLANDSCSAVGSSGLTVLHCAPGFINGVHNNGSNWLCCDGHVKWTTGYQVGGGVTPTLPTNPQVPANANAPGTASMKNTSGNLVTLTFSPI